jgi:hypothetical protein
MAKECAEIVIKNNHSRLGNIYHYLVPEGMEKPLPEESLLPESLPSDAHPTKPPIAATPAAPTAAPFKNLRRLTPFFSSSI